MSANYEQLKKSNLSGSTIYSDEPLQVKQPDGRIVYKQANYVAVDDKREITSVNPQTSVPTTLNNASIDFNIDNGLTDVLQYASLNINLTNNTGANATLVASPLWIDRIQIFGQNGSNMLLDFYGEELYQQFLFLDRYTYESQASAVGLSTTTYNSIGAIVADGTSVEMNIPIYQFFKAIHFATGCLTSPLLLRVKFRSTAMTHITGTAMTLSSIELVVRGKNLKSYAMEKLKDRYSPHSRIPMSLSFLLIDRMPVNQNLVASQTFQITLNGLRGICSYLMFTIRLTSNLASPTAQLNYIRMLNWDILDSSNSSLIGSHRRQLNTQQLDWSNNYGNEAWNQKQFHIMSWSANPRGAFSDGVDLGHALLTGNEKLSVTCPSTLASGAYTIDIYAYCHANLVSEKGVLKIERD